MKRKIAGLVMAFFLTLTLSGCDKLSSGFTDYDVSGYIKSLLDSSYLQQHNAYMEFTKKSEEVAKENNDTTVENGAVYFCNAYGLYPTDQQMAEIQDIIRQAYLLAKVSVGEKEKTNTGFLVDVVIEPLAIFQNCAAEFEQALNDIKNGTLAGNENSTAESAENMESSEDFSEDAQAQSGLADGEEGSAAESALSGEKKLDEKSLLVDEVIRICKEKLKESPTYGSAVTVSMVILQSDEGNLSLDTRQLDEIDKAVMLLPGSTSPAAGSSTAAN